MYNRAKYHIQPCSGDVQTLRNEAMNTETKTARFQVRLTATEAARLDALAKRASCTKNDVFRLALDPDFAAGRDPLTVRKLEEIEAAIAVHAESAAATAERLAGIEKLLADLADLTLAISKNLAALRVPAPPQARPHAAQPAKPAAPAQPSPPSWKEFQAAHPKEYPMMPAAEWAELLAEDYEKKFGIKPDRNS